MTGYHDYLIALIPPANIIEKVKQLKGFSYQKIGGHENQLEQEYIVIQHLPRKKSVWIEPLIPKLERELQTLPPAVLTINGFNFFDEQATRTIYAAIDETQACKIWLKYLRKFFSMPGFEPQITIAKNLNNDDFVKIWALLNKLEWAEEFKVDRLTILRRDTIGYNKSCKIFKEIHFNTKLDFYDFISAKQKAQHSPLKKADAGQVSLFV